MRHCLIGCGNMGSRKSEGDDGLSISTHAKAIHFLKDVDEFVCIDNVLDLAEEAADKWGADDYNDEPLAGFDFYTIAVPADKHLSVVRDILSHTTPKIIVLEKPCGFSFYDCKKIIRLCEQSGTALIVSYQRRFDKILRYFSDIRQEITIECLDDFEHLCHAYDMESWYEGKITLKVVNKTKNSMAFNVYVDGFRVPRSLDHSLYDFYRYILDGHSELLCCGSDIIHTHYVNEYGSN